MGIDYPITICASVVVYSAFIIGIAKILTWFEIKWNDFQFDRMRKKGIDFSDYP